MKTSTNKYRQLPSVNHLPLLGKIKALCAMGAFLILLLLPLIGHGIWLYHAATVKDNVLIIIGLIPFAIPVTAPVGLYSIFFGFPL